MDDSIVELGRDREPIAPAAVGESQTSITTDAILIGIGWRLNGYPIGSDPVINGLDPFIVVARRWIGLAAR